MNGNEFCETLRTEKSTRFENFYTLEDCLVHPFRGATPND